MAATLIHWLLAYKLSPDACGLYYAGNFAPDAIDIREGVTRSDKDKWHLRDGPDREAALKAFYLQIDRNDPFQKGYFVHLFFDMWWDREIISRFEKETESSDWFPVYGNENGVGGAWVYINMPWMDDIVARFKASPTDFKTPLPEPTKDEIIKYNDFMFSPSWKTKYDYTPARKDNVKKNNNKILTPDFLESYTDIIAERYNDWVKNFF